MKKPYGPRPVGYVVLPGQCRGSMKPRQQQPHLMREKPLRVRPDGAHLGC